MKALIAYGSNTGVTAEIAERIGGVLEGEGFEVHLSNLKKEKPSPEEYDLVLVGSGIKIGQWIKESRQYLGSLQGFRGKVALFVSCGDAVVPEKRAGAQSSYLDTIAETYGLVPVSTGLFAGCYNWPRYNFFLKQLMKGILKDQGIVGVDTSKPLDYRDWAHIENWTKELADGVK